jgi:hypothetical protein
MMPVFHLLDTVLVISSQDLLWSSQKHSGGNLSVPHFLSVEERASLTNLADSQQRDASVRRRRTTATSNIATLQYV